MTTRIIRYTSKPRARLSRIFADWQLMTALSITAVIIALNVSFPDLSDPSSQPLSTYQTRIPTIQFRNPIPKFVHLSYLNPKNGSYFKGNDDIYFIGFWVLIWFSFREILMKMFWRPIGTCCNLHLKSSRLQRFTEQGWSLAYCTTFWCMGMKILSAYPKPILAVETRQYWQGYPHDSLPALTKFYYLCQTAFWFQQMIVLNIEKQRKDHYQMLAHHIVSATLICVSYATNFTGLGVAIHTTMDFSDILLSLAKMLNYINAGWVCDTVYVIFVISWIYTRHYVFGKITWDIYSKIELDVPFYWKPEEGYMATRTLYLFFLILLCILQLLLIFWLALILKIMWGVVVGDGADDARSESELVDFFFFLKKKNFCVVLKTLTDLLLLFFFFLLVVLGRVTRRLKK
ncbi:sphingosine N-acyltransferase Lag1 [Phakopsora pachyrhizi]|uniref:Sphingosine N-acyltransferase Lag1 n=1 Tax=Phakopsora pachyrhizi TaxID=170000 RepID=A0AAV0APB3_PHAPC|nr:sphingosine N-acyltransferase Lag1 [Phakopsora pachyrhizi]